MFIATMTAAGAVAASSATVPTKMYVGTKAVGLIERQQIGQFRAQGWTVDCAAAESEFLTRGRSPRERARINVHFWDGAVVGYSRLQTAGRWVIYRWRGRPPPTVAGFAVRRSSTRWDVFRAQRDGWDVLGGQRRVGHTIGPDGPPAATAFLIVC